MKKIGYSIIKVFNFFANNYIARCVVILIIFVSIMVLVTKAFTYKEENIEFKEHIIKIDGKLSKETKMYYSEDKPDTNSLKGIAASELVNCLADDNMESVSDGVNNKIKEIEEYFNSSNNYLGFKYEDIYSGFTVSYNEEQTIFAASVVKAPATTYIYELAAKGEIDLEEYLTYTSNNYIAGSGLLQNRQVGTKYSVRTLVEYAIIHSDNIAYSMLMNRYGLDKMLSFWENKGTTVLYKNGIWGSINAHDMNIYMKELYNFYLQDNEYSNELMEHFLNTTWTPLSSKDDKYKVANKSGWTGTAFHDVAIVFADNPYIIGVVSNTGNSNYTEFFNKVSYLVGELHEIYWQDKMNKCLNINQY